MPISNAHLKGTVQVWDGLSFSMMKVQEAKKLEREGTVQIATNRQSGELMTAAQFNEIREAKVVSVPKSKPKAKTKTRAMKASGTGDNGAQNYKTREMKAE